MDVAEVVRRAKSYVRTIFEDESPEDIGLEEIVYDEGSHSWDVTIGFSRPWETARGPLRTFSTIPAGRSYKMVKVRDVDGKILGLTQRVLAG